MNRGRVEIALPIDANRSLPPTALAQMAKTISASGVVDHFHIWDQMMGWWPPQLWNPTNAPLAQIVPDLDSSCDPSALAAYAAASAPGVGLTISTDAIRRGPAEMMQTMLTLANMGEGRAILQIGAGEIKQTQPFGWKRAEGLKRLEDHFRFYQQFWNTDGPVNLEGNLWKFDQAWIGRARQNRPRVWALGGGPKLIEMAAAYADGFATMVPNVLSTPEKLAEFVRNTKKSVAAKGRDADQFEFCIWVLALIHDDPAVIERAFDNPLIKWLAAIFGRLNNADWASCGVESAFPADWHYSMKLVPNRWTNPVDVEAILSKVTRKMCELTFIHGNASHVAEQIQAYIDAGASCIDLCDTLPIVLEPADAQAGLSRQLDVCARIKKRNAAG
ncbi:MAG: LLM class flavin-dependent oxidoreductase [Steroidobacteraceae bacterium]